MKFEKHIPTSCGTSPGLFTVSTTSGTYAEVAYPTIVSINSSDYPSGTSFYYEAVMKVSAGVAYATLWDNTAGSAVTNAEVTTSSTSAVRVRSSSSITLDGSEYTDRIAASGGNTNTFYGGRVVAVIDNTAIDKVETQVAIFLYSTQTTTSSSFVDFGNIGNSYFLYTAANWDGTVNIYYETTFKTSAATAYSQLATTAGSSVSGSQVTTTSTSFVRARSGAITLSDGTAYKGQHRNDGSNTTSTNSARIIIKQTGNPTKSECYLPSNVNAFAASATGGSYQDSLGRVQYDSSNWSNLDSITWYAEYCYNSNTASGTMEMYGLTDASRVTGSNVTTSATTERKRSGSLTMPSTQNITARCDSASGTVYAAVCHLLAVVTWTNQTAAGGSFLLNFV